MKINIGSSNENTKIITLDKSYDFLNLEESNISLFWHPYNDTFSFSYLKENNNNKLIVTRTDSNCGWAYNHNAYITIKNTILIVEPRLLEGFENTINDSIEKLGSKWVTVFYCGKGTSKIWSKLIKYSVEYRELDVNNFPQPKLYNDFLKRRDVWMSLYGQYVLTLQADCYIVNNGLYTIDYFISLDKSYIGGNMCYEWLELKNNNVKFPFSNFNGGLSLRKRLDMIKIIDTFKPMKTIEISNNNFESYAEDVYFTLGCYKLNLPLGDNLESSRFALHTIFHDSFFGIHQPHNIIKNSINELYPDIKYKNEYLKL